MVIMIFVLQDGVTPLIAASYNGHLEALKILIANKANVNLTDKVYIVYLHILKCMPNYLEVHMASAIAKLNSYKHVNKAQQHARYALHAGKLYVLLVLILLFHLSMNI